MHRCLEVQEILFLIFENLDDNAIRREWPSKNSRTLAALSRTCKAFSEPALDILWHSHVSLGPLVRCLPQDAWTMRKETAQSLAIIHVCGGDLRITRDLVPEDFGRLHYYCHRIRSLGFVSPMISNWNTFDSVILRMLWSCKPRPGPLLPGLRELSIDVTAFQDSALYPRLVIGPVLKNLRISWGEDMEQGFLGKRAISSNMASIIQPASPAITSFKIMYCDAYFGDPGIDCGVEQAEVMLFYRSLCLLKQFRARATYITSSVFTHLASLPDLKKLAVCIHADELVKFNKAIPSDRVVFPGLTKLFIETESLTHVEGLLRRPGFLKLEKLKVAQAEIHDVWEVEPFLAVLARYTKLERIELWEPGFWEPSLLRLSKVTEGALTPLLSLPNLRELVINLGGAVLLNDDLLGRMAEAWPLLEILTLSERTITTRPEATIRSLFTFAASCPHLKRLCLRFNALDDILEHLPPLEDAIPCVTMKYLNICTSPVETCDEVVIFLEVLFPNLKNLDHGWFYTDMFGNPMMPDPEIPLEEFAIYELWGEIEAAWNARRRSRLNDSSV